MRVRVLIDTEAAERTDIPRVDRPAHLLAERWRPVMYLDVDDTLVRYPRGREAGPVVADGAPEFLAWARRAYEVRWLSRWCRDGAMRPDLVEPFCRMLNVGPDVVASISGLDWTYSDTKLNAIAWLEHLVLDRPFVWVEDDWGVGSTERRFLAAHGVERSWRACNVTRRPEALRELHDELRGELATSIGG